MGEESPNHAWGIRDQLAMKRAEEARMTIAKGNLVDVAQEQRELTRRYMPASTAGIWSAAPPGALQERLRQAREQDLSVIAGRLSGTHAMQQLAEEAGRWLGVQGLAQRMADRYGSAIAPSARRAALQALSEQSADRERTIEEAGRIAAPGLRTARELALKELAASPPVRPVPRVIPPPRPVLTFTAIAEFRDLVGAAACTGPIADA